MRVRKSFMTALTIAAATLAAPVIAAEPAAAVGCYGDYCSGKDPEATGCSAGATTTATARINDFTVELRWSPTCKTNWARIQRGHTGSLWVVQTTGYKQTSSSSNNDFRWTAMIYSPQLGCRGEAGSAQTAWA